MELLAVYDDEEAAEAAAAMIAEPKRLASDRDDNQIVWRLFGAPSWKHFYALEMFELPRLKELIDRRKAGQDYDQEEHMRILTSLQYLVNTYGLTIPPHWR